MYFLMILGMIEVNKFAQIRFILKAKFGDDSLLLVVLLLFENFLGKGKGSFTMSSVNEP